ncbi:uncharacterized protein LOC124276717 [Haliotis rubra]|uniref:uncharacterized protein LOC124276717 n=1 Tax=Haliotis rubra TaxID=36100 RepID=UPI001EE52114|nr:uncharacterized protein LOC124276717 [Haliotis rubra]
MSQITSNNFRNTFVTSTQMKKKTKGLGKICNAVNRVNPSVIRTISELKKKGQDIKSSTKTKEALRRKEMKKSGGGKVCFDTLDETEQFAVGIIDDTAIEGVEEDIGTFVGEPSTSTAVVKHYVHVDEVVNELAAIEDIITKSESSKSMTSTKQRKYPKTLNENNDEELIKIEKERLEIERQRWAVDKKTS